MASALLLTPIASAANFASTDDPALFTGEGVGGKWAFETGLGSSECDATSSATLSEGSNTLTINRVRLSDCTAVGKFGPKALAMEMEGCYTLVQIRDRTRRTFTGESHLICPDGASILGYDEERFCAIRIRPQTGTVTLAYTRSAAGGSELQVSTSSIAYDVVYDAPYCPLERGRFETDSQGQRVGE